MQAFELALDGHTYEGLWQRGEYDRLNVQSAFGSTYAYLDGRDPTVLAQSLLRQLIARFERQAG